MLPEIAEPAASDELLIEISSPIAEQLLDFCNGEGDGGGTGGLFVHSDNSILLPSYEDGVSSSPEAYAVAATDGPAALCCYGVDDNAATGFSSSRSLYALFDAPPPPPDSDPDLSFYPSSSSSSSDLLPPPPSAEAFLVPPGPAMYVGDPFDQVILKESMTDGYSIDLATVVPMPSAGGSAMGQPPQGGFEEPCYVLPEMAGLNAPSFEFLQVINAALYGGADSQDLFGCGVPAIGSTARLLTDVAENGAPVCSFVQDAMRSHSYNSGDLQVIGGGSQHPMMGCNSSSSSSSARPMPTSDAISSLDDPTYKVCRLSVEERKEKIHRKTLADSRPRVRGRFARNDELGEVARQRSSSANEFDDDEEMVVKGEGILDSSNILAHINGVNSFNYNYTLESWI
ncbi:hypothetical protein ZIOFF_033046 [Zingiber officinale]|uniref:CCT domain-containing protein n=1 Tax=Zingiber officinale TaxID=94328 RepID=A0A8J5L6S9_ZINOF|nr:hypothetical protein ZIOFF_033046 [Zingiber officinale]